MNLSGESVRQREAEDRGGERQEGRRELGTEECVEESEDNVLLVDAGDD
jgi:hypothetical protein